ncbi:MAG: hypothetical protein Q4D98_01015 [Planctomycetia bacterium]|nr:hypothetical protein [Planctomycetia bacterium]
MMKNATVTVSPLRAIDWNQVCPWLLLTKCLRLGFSFRLLFITTFHLAFCMLLLAWAFMYGVTENTYVHFIADAMGKYSIVDQNVPVTRTALFFYQPEVDSSTSLDQKAAEMASQFQELGNPQPKKIERPARPLWGQVLVLCYVTFVSVLLYMAFARITAVKIATDTRPYLLQAMRFAWGRLPAITAAIVFIGLGIIAVVTPSWLVRFLPQWSMILVTPLALMLNVLAVFIVIGGVVGIPFVLSTLMAENSDCFDGLSRAYAYTFQRPLRYAFYLLAALFFGVLGYLAMRLIIACAIGFFFYCAGKSFIDEPNLWVWIWTYIMGLVPLAFCIVYSNSAMTGIYMLLRRDVDAVELDNVWLENPQTVPTPKLPTLR